MKFYAWARIVAALYLGILAVVLGRAAIRSAWTIAHDIRTEMPPTIGLLTAPLLSLEILVLAAILEAAIGYFDRSERPVWQYFVIGASYCSVLALTISVPVGVVAMLVLNPVTVRWVLQRLVKQTQPR